VTKGVKAKEVDLVSLIKKAQVHAQTQVKALHQESL